jgi:hypothetical protein
MNLLMASISKFTDVYKNSKGIEWDEIYIINFNVNNFSVLN